MAITPRSMSGRIRGRTIELDTESGLPDGQTVTVTVEPALRQAATETTLEALRRAAGSWSDDPDGLDRFLEWNRLQRKINRRELPE